LKDSLGFF